MDDMPIVDTITTNLVDLISMTSTLVEHLKGKHDRRDRLSVILPERSHLTCRASTSGQGSDAIFHLSVAF
jgi:hypothetical protein